jgi:hypothetical protein
MHNKKQLVRRIIEPGNRHYSFGIFTSDPHGSGGRQLTAVVEGTYQDAVKLLKSERTESGHSFKGFRKMKAS